MLPLLACPALYRCRYHMKTNWQPTKLERRVQGIARRRTTKQLMPVPWARFHKAYEEYLRWEALALWVRATQSHTGAKPWKEI